MTVLLLIACMAVIARPSTTGSSPRIKFPGEKCYTYRIELLDKCGSGYSLDKPKQFLSPKAIERRRRLGLKVDSTDLPVSYVYMRQIASDVVRIIGTSKWNNTVLINCTDTTPMQRIRRLPCVKTATMVWTSPDSITARVKRSRKNRDGFNPWDSVHNAAYGKAEAQIEALGGIRLHQQGYRGEGMTIAVLDGGFAGVDRKQVFKNVDIKGVKDFVYPASPVFYNETDHGTKVLSAMAINAPNVYIGTAPKASYWLLRCEDQQSEQPVEEDYWAMAAEFADSVGVDVINSSLGYYEYDNHYGDHPLWHLLNLFFYSFYRFFFDFPVSSPWYSYHTAIRTILRKCSFPFSYITDAPVIPSHIQIIFSRKFYAFQQTLHGIYIVQKHSICIRQCIICIKKDHIHSNTPQTQKFLSIYCLVILPYYHVSDISRIQTVQTIF